MPEFAGMGTYFRAEWSTFSIGGQTFYGQKGKLRKLGEALNAGMPIREAARIAGCGRNTAKKFYYALVYERQCRDFGPILCPCGKPSIHQGWCWVRLDRHPARKNFLKVEWPARQRARRLWWRGL